jgi:hypothetical protein
MLTLVTVGRYSHLNLSGCLALQQYFVAHGRVSQLTHQIAPVAYLLQQKHLCRCQESNPGRCRPKPTRYHYTIQTLFTYAFAWQGNPYGKGKGSISKREDEEDEGVVIPD